MALSVEQIVARVESLRYRSHERDARNLDVLAVRKGKIIYRLLDAFAMQALASRLTTFLARDAVRPRSNLIRFATIGINFCFIAAFSTGFNPRSLSPALTYLIAARVGLKPRLANVCVFNTFSAFVAILFFLSIRFVPLVCKGII